MLESKLPGEIPITSDMQMTPPLCTVKNYYRDFPGGPVVKDSKLLLQGVWV